MVPDISVILCTRNRAASLDTALRSLTACATADLNWELLVIDNGSTDQTALVTASYHDRLPIRTILEPTAGLSHARNRGVAEATGEWLVWIDDDVTVPYSWIGAYANAIKCHGEVSLLGGPINVVLLGDPPKWLREGSHFVADAFGARTSPHLKGPIRLIGPKPYGANFACTRSAAECFPFDPALGRHPTQPTRGGEELDVMRRILSDGGRGRWVPEAGLDHQISPERQTERYLGAYYRQAGFAAAISWSDLDLTNRTRRVVSSAARCLAHRAVHWLLKADLTRPRRARNVREAAWHSGYVRECARQMTRKENSR